MDIRDLNGTGKWSAEAIGERYRTYARELAISPELDMSPRTRTEGDVTCIYPVIDRVIEGIEHGDPACIAIGIELVEEDQHLHFGKILKSNAARALRRAQLSGDQVERLRKRIAGMLLVGMVPHEYKEYAKLLRKIGLGSWRSIIDEEVRRDDQRVMKYYNYLSRLHD